MKIAVICVGNQLMLDDGLGIEVYEQVKGSYELPSEVDLICAGCLTMDMVSKVGDYDMIITVDAIDETGSPAGTIFRYTPDDVARRGTPMGSLHELKLADLFDAASLIGLASQGICLGMQVENATPSEYVVGLTPAVLDKIPLLVDTLLAELVALGCNIIDKEGVRVTPGYHHRMVGEGHA